ncbi:multidrug effflux MFS transporter [Kovacikia minuta CCNUW1]|uniref:multidrug effflux MFS transporter n=1 Tax=Kovacikia minuta TaxID=2931930 RepID=UPI001CD03695|nr:multidrug effflux MFS transporter [Kovacikia minuta]UBF27215.1 multidrug effflux MFS transporter [Kovacikia minuta CCNUW1]
MTDGDRATVNPAKGQVNVIIYACLGVFLGQAAYFIYLPSLLQMQADFGVDAAAMQNSIAVYAAGYGFSQLLWGPYSDQIGRKPVAMIGMGLATLASLVLSFTNAYGWFQVVRLVQGIGAGCGTSVSRAALRDTFVSTRLAQAMSYLSFAYAGALGLAPFLGGQIANWSSWRSDFIFLAILGILSLLYIFYFLPETKQVEESSKNRIFNLSLITNYLKILVNPNFLLPALTCAIATGMIALYDAISPFDFEKTFGFTPTQFGNTSLAITLAYLVGGILVNRGVIALGQKFFLRLGLFLILCASAGMLALGIMGTFNIYSLLLPMFLVVVGCGIIIPICFALSLHPFPTQAGLASALVGLVQQESTGLIIALSTYLSTTSQIPLALVLLLLGLVSVGLVRYFRFSA